MQTLIENGLILILFLLFLLLVLWLYLTWARTKGRFPFSRFPRQEFYIQNQVIVTGPEAAVNAVLAGLSGVHNEPVRVLRFNELGIGACDGLPPDLVIGLYRLSGLFPNVERAIRQIREELSGPAQGVNGEPNYLSGHPWDPEGSPWDPEGSPWDPEGSPWDPEGSPLQSLLGLVKKKEPVPPADPQWFMQQWAWQVIQLGAGAEQRASGAGVRVGVFDTSPYFPGLPEGGQAMFASTLAQNPAPLNLNVKHPVFRAHPEKSVRPATDVRNHGYYISGLVHALAPGCDLHLVRVLENDNRGDLFTLMEAIFEFLRDAVSNPPERGMVINLSLGIRVPPEEARFGLPLDVLSLQYLMRAARCLNAVVVAAAGNDSMGAEAAKSADLPAGWNTTLGVAATNPENVRACFSNRGDIAAPGGDGRARRSEKSRRNLAAGGQAGQRPADSGCRPRNADCVDGNSGWAVVGPVIDPPGKQAGYIFWSGTSFSTPMVAGLAALVLDFAGRRLTPEEVENILRCGATRSDDPALGAGVINVQGALRCAAEHRVE